MWGQQLSFKYAHTLAAFFLSCAVTVIIAMGLSSCASTPHVSTFRKVTLKQEVEKSEKNFHEASQDVDSQKKINSRLKTLISTLGSTSENASMQADDCNTKMKHLGISLRKPRR